MAGPVTGVTIPQAPYPAEVPVAGCLRRRSCNRKRNEIGEQKSLRDCLSDVSREFP